MRAGGRWLEGTGCPAAWEPLGCTILLRLFFPMAALVPGPGQDGHGTWGLLPEGCGRCEMLPCPLNAGGGALL